MLEKNSLSLIPEILNCLESGFDHLPPYMQEVDIESIRDVLLTVAEKMRDNLPYPHPLYVGQMLKPPHPIARLAYTLALWMNPNNHAMDGGGPVHTWKSKLLLTLPRCLAGKHI
ncbi:hypothetical protein [Legionella sainthelensi]|uniref:hypothetical protein n=1 Tax=Legionella sainthelensi TaxID=28087 RepID=UPI000F6D85D7|nr:hypothetical protein [Legionella sainthelensi]VEH31117.1 pyridoxal-dependent decarboxylase [Legionella sainthelensi]